MKNQLRWLVVGVIAAWCCFLNGCVLWEFEEAMASFPPEEKIWIRKGWNSAQVDVELSACYRQRKLPSYPFSIESGDEIDLCMLHKGFKFVPKPDRGTWNNVCRVEEKRVRCRVYRGELVVPPDETALQIKPDPLVKPKPVLGYVECRKDEPKHEAAYCECSLRTRYENPDPCAHLLKSQDRSVDIQVEPSTEKTESAPMTPVLNPSEQVLREKLKELQRAQEKTQIKPYTPPANLPVVPQVPNPRLEKLKGG